jgi:hypothetical protein
MANADAFMAGFGTGKKDSMKDKKPGERSGLFTKPAQPSSYKKGGKVKKTGTALVHKGEVVLTKAEAKKYKKKETRKRTGSKG